MNTMMMMLMILMQQVPFLLLLASMRFGGSAARSTTTSTSTGTAVLGNELPTLDGTYTVPDTTSYRHNFCPRAQALEQSNGTIALSNVLQGATISIGVFAPSKYFLFDPTTGINPTYPGVNARVLDYIAEQANFTWRDTFGVIAYADNETFTDIIARSVNKYDIVVGMLTPSIERMNQQISFIEGIYDGSLILVRDVQPTEKKTVNWFNWMKPFTYAVWGTIIGIVVFSSVAYQLIEWVGGRREPTMSTRKWTTRNLYRGFINFTGNYSYEPETLGGQIFSVFFAFWAMLITAAYTANLASELVSRDQPTTILTDVNHAINLGMTMCVDQGTYSDTYMRKMHPRSIPLLVPVKFGLDDNFFLPLLEGRCDVRIGYKQVYDTGLLKDETNPKCSLQWQGQAIKEIKDGYATKSDSGTKCTDLVNEVLNYYIRAMEDSNFLINTWDEHNQYYATPDHCVDNKDDDSSDDDTSALNLHDMAGTMLWQVYGSFLAILVACVSRWELKRNVKGKTKRRDTSLKISQLHNKQHDDEIGTTITMNNHSLSSLPSDHKRLDALAEQMQAMMQMMEVVIETQTAQQQREERARIRRADDLFS